LPFVVGSEASLECLEVVLAEVSGLRLESFGSFKELLLSFTMGILLARSYSKEVVGLVEGVADARGNGILAVSRVVPLVAVRLLDDAEVGFFVAKEPLCRS